MFSSNKRIFTYWVCPGGKPAPAYIQLCIQTWYDNIPDVEVIILNHDNLFEWIDPFFDSESFYKLSLMQQSDVVSFAVLFRHGGMFLDADTIVTKDIFEEFDRFDMDKLHFFGNPATQGVHMALMAVGSAGHPFLRWCVECEKQLMDMIARGLLSAPFSWDMFSNSIVNELKNDPALRDTFVILDKSAQGAILENLFLQGENYTRNFLKFYLIQNDIDFDDVLGRIRFGAVLLHNSWVPDQIAEMTFEQIEQSGLLLHRLLRHALKGGE